MQTAPSWASSPNSPEPRQTTTETKRSSDSEMPAELIAFGTGAVVVAALIGGPALQDGVEKLVEVTPAAITATNNAVNTAVNEATGAINTAGNATDNFINMVGSETTSAITGAAKELDDVTQEGVDAVASAGKAVGETAQGSYSFVQEKIVNTDLDTLMAMAAAAVAAFVLALVVKLASIAIENRQEAENQNQQDPEVVNELEEDPDAERPLVVEDGHPPLTLPDFKDAIEETPVNLDNSESESKQSQSPLQELEAAFKDSDSKYTDSQISDHTRFIELTQQEEKLIEAKVNITTEKAATVVAEVTQKNSVLDEADQEFIEHFAGKPPNRS